jgi:hypothetical protein
MGCGLDLSDLEYGSVARSCKADNETLNSTKGGEYIG